LLQPNYAKVDDVEDFADQFSRQEAENIQLHKAVKPSTDQVLEANKLVAEAQGKKYMLKGGAKKVEEEDGG
jgi:hypothetical protein